MRVCDRSHSHLQAQTELQSECFSIGALRCAEVFAIGSAAECACFMLPDFLAHALQCSRVAIIAGVRPGGCVQVRVQPRPGIRLARIAGLWRATCDLSAIRLASAVAVLPLL